MIRRLWPAPKKPGIFPIVVASSFQTLPYLPLGMVIAFLRHWQNGELCRHYDIHRLRLSGVMGHPLAAVVSSLEHEAAPICLLSSYVWNHTLNLTAMEQIKAVNPRARFIMGGPEIPKYEGETEAFLQDNPHVDIAVLGEGELACAEILAALAGDNPAAALRSVNGIVYRDGDNIVRTAVRDRILDVNALPSPYLNNEFEPWFRQFKQTVLETNRGCPYGCTYCDWGSATLAKVTRFSPERVVQEIDYLAKCKSESVFIADANFGMLEQDIEIAEALVAVRRRTGYPKRLYTNFAKNGGRRLMTVIKILHEGGLLPTGIIALQTTDSDTLKAIKRDNIKTAAYETMMEYFNAEGIPMASDIMIGLPGQTVNSLQADLQFCFDWKVSANGNYTAMMPNAPMAEKSYRAEYKIVTDNNNMIASTASFTADDLTYMKDLFRVYQFHVRLGMLKYYLYYVQLEHGIQAIALLRRWLDCVLAQDPLLPISCSLFRQLLQDKSGASDWAPISWNKKASFFFDDLESYYHEFYQFTVREFGLSMPDSVLATLVSAQDAVSPKLNRDYPYAVELNHDIEEYFSQIKRAPSVHQIEDRYRPLHDYSPATLEVTPEVPRIESIDYFYVGGHSDDWELPSALRFY
ncbi:MAG: radical SAM protein [Halioglobus sp.]|nr:radical SAM protein [Halioglobus sp.]